MYGESGPEDLINCCFERVLLSRRECQHQQRKINLSCSFRKWHKSRQCCFSHWLLSSLLSLRTDFIVFHVFEGGGSRSFLLNYTLLCTSDNFIESRGKVVQLRNNTRSMINSPITSSLKFTVKTIETMQLYL
jgi:hypothetical protein